MKIIKKIIILFIIFFVGISIGYLIATVISKAKSEIPTTVTPKTSTKSSASQISIISPTQLNNKVQLENNTTNIFNSYSKTSKFTITESKKLSSDRATAQTGERLSFYAGITNTGQNKKFLTHICFESSNGPFGCIRNHNLGPNESLSFSNSATFNKVGNYIIWISWSQDGVNFYKPNNASSIKVEIY
jgi:hypothetical protein